MNMPQTAKHPFDFLDPILVECPACHGRAELRRQIDGTRQFKCTACFSVRDISPSENGVITYPPSRNICNGLALWLEADTRLGTLYAFNFEHLEHIATYVAAHLRRVDFSRVSFRNSAVTSRLPLWVKAAKNRQEVLKAIDKLRRK
ncbi:MAG TPA: hypothetical protein VLZ84_11660 [Asticcacaulis sp.]|nr:hypothetical protein [Asticcacaulis sp.]